MFGSIHVKLPPIAGGFLRYWLSLYCLCRLHSLRYLRIKIRV